MKSVITSVVCAGLAVSLPCAAGGQESPSESLLELRLSTDKSSIILTEPINVRFHLMNLKGEPFAIDNLFDYKGVLGAQFGKKGARRLKPFNLPLSGYRKGPQTVPIEGLYYDLLMAFDPHAGSAAAESSRAPFWETGVYELQAWFWPYQGVKIFSNIVEILVEEPEGVDAEAIGVWKDEDIDRQDGQESRDGHA